MEPRLTRGVPADSYHAFAYAYDAALGEKFFRAVSKLFDRLLDRYPGAGTSHLDLACGTGLITEYFSHRGFDSVGIDSSIPMLCRARLRHPRIVASDIRALPFNRPFDRITCVYDSLNHLLDEADLLAVFRAARRVMNPDSLFLFDLNHPDVYPRVWGVREPFVSTGRDYVLSISTRYSRVRNLAVGDVSGWVTLDGNRVSISETHFQRAWSEKQVRRILARAGLRPVEVFPFDPFDERSGPVKIFFVVRAG